MIAPSSFALVAAALLAQGAGRPQAGGPVAPVTAVRKTGSSTPRRVRAAQARTPIKLDGRLDDEAWKSAEVAGDFVQSEPNTGQPATEATEVRVVYDATTLYVGAFLHEREPADVVVNEIRKDFKEEDQDDFEVILDTFRDRHNGYVFITNVEGAKLDRQVAGEGREVNGSWDAVWDVRTTRVEGGWTVEMAIPFKSLRYDPKIGRAHV